MPGTRPDILELEAQVDMARDWVSSAIEEAEVLLPEGRSGQWPEMEKVLEMLKEVQRVLRLGLNPIRPAILDAQKALEEMADRADGSPPVM
jgi:hypothetical protein